MNTRVRLAVLSAAVTVTVLSVTGCAPATPTNTATVTVTESVSTPVPSETASGTPAESPEAPAEDDRTGEAMAGGFQGIALDMPFSEAMKAAEVTSIDVCPWAAFGEREGYQLIVARDSEGADDSPLLEVAALAPPDTTDLVGPRTASGIGIGSTVDEAKAAYPEAEELSGNGRQHLLVETSAFGSLFLTYTEGASVIWGVTATSRDMPSYEFCG